MRAMVAVLAAVTLFGAACGGSVDVGIEGGDAEQFCTFLESDTAVLETQFGGSFDEDTEAFLDALSALRRVAPGEISDDMDVLVDVTETLVAAFDDIDQEDPAALGEMLGVMAELEPRSAEIEAASTRVQQWAIANCDLPEDFTVFDNGASDGSLGSDLNGYGDDPALDALWDDCAAGDLAACDSLWFDAPFGSEYEDFGDTCGGTTTSSSGGCEFNDQFGTDGNLDVNLPEAYGDDPVLDGLYDDCAAGDMIACDNLYFSSPIDSDYESFGQTCGGTANGPPGSCASDGPIDGPFGYGDDPELDALYDSCDAGDLAACDDLYFSSPFDSDYESFGSTCGGRSDGGAGFCADPGEFSGDAFTYGDDAALDALWDGCEAGDLGACDNLWWDAPVGSEYETFAESCGGRSTEPLLADCEADLSG